MTGRPLPEDYLDEWAGRLAIAKKEHERGLVSAIVFRIGEELLALRASIFLEVSTELMPHRIPHRAQGAIAGLVNVRGELLPYVSMSLLLSLSADAHSGEREGGFSRRVAVVQKDGKWAFPVSAMQGIQRVNEATLKEPPATVGKALRKFTRGLFDSPDGPVALLDEELLFYTLKVEIA
jgi:chemotaxis-related protein WspD